MGQKVFLQDMQFPVRLLELRKSRGLSQAALAAKTGGLVSRTWIMNAENGRLRQAELLSLQKVAEVLNVSVDHLMKGENYLRGRGGDLTVIVPIDISLTREEEETIRQMVDQMVRIMIDCFRKKR